MEEKHPYGKVGKDGLTLARRVLISERLVLRAGNKSKNPTNLE